MQEINRILQRCVEELNFNYIRAAGPGGQNVNKVATAVQLRFDVKNSPSLSKGDKDRFVLLAGKRITNEGVLVIEARRYRSQDKNREDAVARFTTLIRQSLARPKPRKQTKRSTTSKEKRLASKKKRSEIKRTRRSQSFD